ncbi:hypothetical protein OSB04_028261 [Centaurea solstitialis]|uniref:DUF4219 domain-containing protein n=1 Tax=Centaurea solstitialis TaxID=347529 RepID=A0AA38SFE1_9ASTR|nr:hypothetical protein OSB04_028261 [Centaurea solstitialis]
MVATFMRLEKFTLGVNKFMVSQAIWVVGSPMMLVGAESEFGAVNFLKSVKPFGGLFGFSGLQFKIIVSFLKTFVAEFSRNMPSQMITIDKFTGKNNFSLWRIKMRALLKQQGIWTSLSCERPDEMTESEFAKQDEKAHSTILLSLADEVIYEVADEESAASLYPLKIDSCD